MHMQLPKRCIRSLLPNLTRRGFARMLMHNSDTFALAMDATSMRDPDARFFFYYFSDVDDLLCNAFTLFELSIYTTSAHESADLSDLYAFRFQGELSIASYLLQQSVCFGELGQLYYLSLRFVTDALETVPKFGQILFVPSEKYRASLLVLRINMTLTRFSKYVLGYYAALRRLELVIEDDANIVIGFPTLPQIESLSLTKQDLNAFEIVDLMDHLRGLRDLHLRTSIISYNNLNLRREGTSYIADKVQQDITDHQTAIQSVMFTSGSMQTLVLESISSVPVDIFLIMITLQPHLAHFSVTAEVVNSKFTSLNFDVLEKLKHEELQLYDDNITGTSQHISSQYDQIVYRLKNRNPLLYDTTSFYSISHSSDEDPSEIVVTAPRISHLHTLKYVHAKACADEDEQTIHLRFYDAVPEQRFKLRKCRSALIVHCNEDFVEISSPKPREHMLSRDLDTFLRDNIEVRFPYCRFDQWPRARLISQRFPPFGSAEHWELCYLTLRECEARLGESKASIFDPSQCAGHFESSQCQFSYHDIYNTVTNERTALQKKHFVFDDVVLQSGFYEYRTPVCQAGRDAAVYYGTEETDGQQAQLLLILAIPVGLLHLDLHSVALDEYPLVVLLRQLKSLRKLTLLSFPVIYREIRTHATLYYLYLCDQGYLQLYQVFDAFPNLTDLVLMNTIFDGTTVTEAAPLRRLELRNCRNISIQSVSRLLDACAETLGELHCYSTVMPLVTRYFARLRVAALHEMIISFSGYLTQHRHDCITILLNLAPNLEILEYWNCRETQYCGKLTFDRQCYLEAKSRGLVAVLTDDHELRAAIAGCADA